MIIHFQDDIYIDGRPSRAITLVEGQSVWVYALYPRYFVTRLFVNRGQLVAHGFTQYRYDDQILLVRAEAVQGSRIQAQQRIDYGTGYLVTAIAEPRHTLVWLDGEQSYCFYMPPMSQATIAFSPQLCAVGVYGDLLAPIDTANPMHGSLLGLDGTVLFDGDASSFALDVDWMVVCTYADMRGHQVTTHYGYRDGAFGTLAHTCISTRAHTYISTLYPHLFAQALLVGDEDEAKQYLAPALAAEWPALLAYLGTVATLAHPDFLLPDNVVAWADGDGVGKRFAFTLQDDRIEDICRVDV